MIRKSEDAVRKRGGLGDEKIRAFAVGGDPKGRIPTRRAIVAVAGAVAVAALTGCTSLWHGRVEENGRAHTEGVKFLAVAAGGKLLASGGGEGAVKLWSLPDGAYIKTLEGNVRGISGLVATGDGKSLVSAGSDSLKFWSFPSGALTNDIRTYMIDCLAPVPGSNSVATGRRDGELTITDQSSGGGSGRGPYYVDQVRCVVFVPGGRMLAAGERGGGIELFSAGPWSIVRSVGHTGAVNCLAMAPGGKWFVSGGDDAAVRLWSLPRCTPLRTLAGHTNHVLCLAITADGKMLASGDADGRIKLWSLPSGSPVKTLEAGGIPVNCLAFTPDGAMLASGSEDGRIRLWSLPSGELRMIPMDIAASRKDTRGFRYTAKDAYGNSITYTLPCGSPAPKGADHVGPCVPGAYEPPKPGR